MTEYDLLLIGSFLTGAFGLVTMFSATVDGRSTTAPGLMIIIACALFFLASGEAPNGRIQAIHIPQAFIHLANRLLS